MEELGARGMLRRPVRRRGRARGRTVCSWLATSGDGRAGKPARGKDGCVPPSILDRTASTYDVGWRGDSVGSKAASSHAISANMASRGAAHRANSVRMRSNTASSDSIGASSRRRHSSTRARASDSAARAAASCRRRSSVSAANTASWRRRSSTRARAADSAARVAASCRRRSSAAFSHLSNAANTASL